MDEAKAVIRSNITTDCQNQRDKGSNGHHLSPLLPIFIFI